MNTDARHAKLLQYAQQLRKNMTEQERILWFTFLRNHPLRFYRQKVMGNYILDFYCHRAKLAIVKEMEESDNGKQV